MRSVVFVGLLIFIASHGSPQMVGGMMGQGVMWEQHAEDPEQPRQHYPCPMEFGMMGYGMGHGMMGFGLWPPLMMRPGLLEMLYGCGMGFGLGPRMTGCGMDPCMMGYGRGPGMVGYGMCGDNAEENQKFLDETGTLRKELHNKRFEYFEAYRDPKTKPETIQKIENEIRKLQKKIYEKSQRNYFE